MEEGKKKKVLVIGVILLLLIIIAFLFIFKTKKYTVQFSGANVEAIEVSKNGTATKPADPVKEGYNFVGWYTEDGKEFDFNTKVTSDIKLEAKWEKAIVSNITFKNEDGTVISSAKTANDGTVTRPADPVKEGYDFIGWYNGDVMFDFSSPATSDVELVAKFKKKDSSKTTYTVTFDTDGGSYVASQTIEENKTATKPANPTKTGYIFVSWQLDGKDYDFSSKVTKNITIKATWKKGVTYTVTFNSDGGSKVNTQTVEENKTATKPANPTKTGYTFVSWQLDGKNYDFSSKVTKNITLKATWKEKTKCTVTYDADGGSAVASKTLYCGDAIGTLPTTTKSGYTFGGWYSGSTKYSATTKVNSNVTLKASWTEIKKCTVTFNSDGGSSVSGKEVNCGSTIGTLTTPTKEGYTFGGWYLGSTKYTSSSKVNSNITLKASWTAKKYTIRATKPEGDSTNETSRVITVYENGSKITAQVCSGTKCLSAISLAKTVAAKLDGVKLSGGTIMPATVTVE